MPECANCGGFVTPDYERVFSLPDRDQVRCCPNCEDKIRAGNGVRESRGTRQNGAETTTYDENYDNE